MKRSVAGLFTLLVVATMLCAACTSKKSMSSTQSGSYNAPMSRTY